jgi:hypothetical protein
MGWYWLGSLGGPSLFTPDWRKLWIGSLVVAAVCGFTYGWQERLENPPFDTVIKGKEPPQEKLMRKGRYDEAAKVILDSIKDEKKDWLKYESLAAVYGARAFHDPSNRENWLQQSAFYVDKGVSLAPNDPVDLMSAAFSTESIGEASSQPCPYYDKASQYARDAMSELKTDSIFVGDERMPTQPLRNDIGKLMGKLQGKIEANCTHQP